MPEESKKNQQKGPKDQRKPRNRHQAGPAEKKIEKKSEEPKVPQKPPVYEEPGPEFYKGLKRETDEILKITEEANSKYKKKEIQSNWSKYEMPIESYDEIEEQENMGADYEKLIEAPLSIGGHFQFKHEKSWDVDTGPSVYDKYFEVNMDNLFLSIASIPFHERINVDKSIFSETDILTMNNRATRFKQKYYNNKNFTTPELIVEDNILNSLKENIERVEDSRHDVCEEESEQIQEHLDLIEDKIIEKIQGIEINEIKLGNEKPVSTEMESVASNSSNKFIQAEPSKIAVPKPNKENNEDIDNFDDLILGDKNVRSQELKTKNMDLENKAVADNHAKPGEPTVPTKSPVIESPEDLEKWLDDFLDG